MRCNQTGLEITLFEPRDEVLFGLFEGFRVSEDFRALEGIWVSEGIFRFPLVGLSLREKLL